MAENWALSAHSLPFTDVPLFNMSCSLCKLTLLRPTLSAIRANKLRYAILPRARAFQTTRIRILTLFPLNQRVSPPLWIRNLVTLVRPCIFIFLLHGCSWHFILFAHVCRAFWPRLLVSLAFACLSRDTAVPKTSSIHLHHRHRQHMCLRRHVIYDDLASKTIGVCTVL